MRTRITFRKDTSRLDRISRGLDDQVDDFLSDAAHEFVQLVRSSWSPNSPSSPGRPPAVVSGELDSSVEAEKVGRGFGGRFAGGGNVQSWSAKVGARHGVFLEQGTSRMQARPFISPAVAAVSVLMPVIARSKVRIG